MIGRNYKFELTDDEYERLNDWWNENFKCRHFGTIGGGLTFHITPTSIGEIVEAECLHQKITIRDL